MNDGVLARLMAQSEAKGVDLKREPKPERRGPWVRWGWTIRGRGGTWTS